MKYKTFKEWFNDIKWLQYKIILPDGNTIDKKEFITKNGFDIDGLNSFLFKTYNKIYLK